MGVTLLGKGKLQKEEPCGPGFTHLNYGSVNPSIFEVSFRSQTLYFDHT